MAANRDNETDTMRTQPNIKKIDFKPKDNRRLFVASFEIKNKDGGIIPREELEVALRNMRLTDRRNLIYVDYRDILVGSISDYRFMIYGGPSVIEIEGEIFDDTYFSNLAWGGLKTGFFEGFSFSGRIDGKTGKLVELDGLSLVTKFRITVSEGLEEFTKFLNSRDIPYTREIQKSYDAQTIIDISNIFVGVAGITVSLVVLIVEFKKWLESKNNTKKIVINLTNNITEITHNIYLNSDSEEQIRDKINKILPTKREDDVEGASK